MAMTGVRRITVGLGLVQKLPPEEIATEGVPALLAQVAPEHRETAIELLHWGSALWAGWGSASFRLAFADAAGGAAYGLAILGVFEVAAAQWLGIGKKERAIWERFALAGDHVLYGIVLVDESEGRLSG